MQRCLSAAQPRTRAASPRLPPGCPDSTTAEVEFFLDSYFNKTDLLGHIDNIGLQGGLTYTALGLQTLRESVFVEAAGFRGNMTVVIVLTDGHATDAGLLAAQSALLVDMVCVLCLLTACLLQWNCRCSNPSCAHEVWPFSCDL